MLLRVFREADHRLCCVSGFISPDLAVDADGGAPTIQPQLDWRQNAARGEVQGPAGTQERGDLLPELSGR